MYNCTVSCECILYAKSMNALYVHNMHICVVRMYKMYVKFYCVICLLMQMVIVAEPATAYLVAFYNKKTNVSRINSCSVIGWPDELVKNRPKYIPM
jgi:hypothetical protein